MLEHKDVVLLALGTVLGLVAAVAVGYYFFFRGGAKRTRVTMRLSERSRMDPQEAGVLVELRVAGRNIENLLTFDLLVHNHGPLDVDVQDAADPDHRADRSRFMMPSGVFALTDPWNPTGRSSHADVRGARKRVGDRQVIFVHVHRLAVGREAIVRVLCHYVLEANPPQFTGKDFSFGAGFLADREIEGQGLLAQAVPLDEWQSSEVG